eukprot:6315829-Lingulodinium_polyedra.AAC.1
MAEGASLHPMVPEKSEQSDKLEIAVSRPPHGVGKGGKVRNVGNSGVLASPWCRADGKIRQ